MKKILSLTLLIFALFIASCTTGGGTSGGGFFGSSRSSKSQVSDINVFVGTQGLTAEFGKNAPPPRVFESSSFPILLRIRNSGAYGITSNTEFGVISIGRERDYIPSLSVEKNNMVFEGTTDNEVFFHVEGKTKINPKGDEIVVFINAKTGKLDPQSEQKLSNIITATLCYPYKTMLSTTVCIDPDTANVRPGKKVCEVKELAYTNGQGAPIAVTKIEPQMIPEKDKAKGEDVIKPQFLIFIENRGRGSSVDKKSYYNVCGKVDFYDPKYKEELKNIWNVATLRAYTTGKEKESQLICCPNIEGQCPEKDFKTEKEIEGFIRFRDKKDFVRCTFRDENAVSRSEDAYTSPLRIEIDYGYIQTISTNFVIQKPLKY